MADDEALSVRCYCRKHPLLAVCGRDAETGQGFVHVKSFRGDRIFTEVIATGGEVRLRCRDCNRWHVITIRGRDVAVAEEALPRRFAAVAG